MNYQDLSREDFDAIITGELTHYAIWLEDVLVKLISHHFAPEVRRKDFERLMLRRDGLTFQDKIEIVRAMLPLFENRDAAEKLKQLLGRIEVFKANRNAFAHGLDVTPKELPPPTVHVEIITRSGKEKVLEVSPEVHREQMASAEALLNELNTVANEIIA